LLTRERIGRKAPLAVLRDGAIIKLSLLVSERPDERRSV
jgi:hypothetical protein